MISDSDLHELKVYRELERSLALETRPELGSLVVANSNDNTPVHRWFRFKEAYSPDLLGTLLGLWAPGRVSGTLLDPYCGVGTTLLSAQTLASRELHAVGIEYNPFIRFVAETKLAWPLVDPAALMSIGGKILKATTRPSCEIPALSGLTTGRCMSRYVTGRLAAIRNAIIEHGNSPTHRALLLGLAAAIEPLSLTRKDGRALRLVDKPRQAVAPVLWQKWQTIADDVRALKATGQRLNTVQVLAGDGRKPEPSAVPPGSVDIIVTSPPYPNNIDYSEVYKLELWLLGFVQDAVAFLRLRKGTLRSHPTSDFSLPEHDFLRRVSTDRLKKGFQPLLSKLDTEHQKWRRRLFVAYFSDMATTLMQFYSVLRCDGLAFITVGNSLHGGKYVPYVIATDLLISELARSFGFAVERIAIARSLKRRLTGNHFLRESVIVLRKPNA